MSTSYLALVYIPDARESICLVLLKVSGTLPNPDNGALDLLSLCIMLYVVHSYCSCMKLDMTSQSPLIETAETTTMIMIMILSVELKLTSGGLHVFQA